MVHALQHVHRMLRPDGLLINIHDLPVPHLIEVQSEGTAIKAGWLTHSIDFENERLAFNALAQVVSEGNFYLEDERDFDFNIHMKDINELQEWLSEWWESAVLTDGTIKRIEELLRSVDQPSKIVLISPTRMTKLSVRD